MTNFTRHIAKLALPAAALTMLGMANAHAPSDDTQPVTCTIDITKGRYGTTYEGVVHASSAIQGSYDLMIRKRGASGSAMISQGGDFHVAAGETETLGRTTFGGLPPDRVTAELTLHWQGHSLSCSNHDET